MTILFLRDRERERERETQREKEKQTPHQEPNMGLDPRLHDHSLSQRQMLNPLSHPGIPDPVF